MAPEEWNEIKQKWEIGTQVEGIIVHKAPFGDFIDVGVGYDALLEIIEIKDLTQEKYCQGDYNPMGSVVKAKVVAFDDTNKQIRLTQK